MVDSEKWFEACVSADVSARRATDGLYNIQPAFAQSCINIEARPDLSLGLQIRFLSERMQPQCELVLHEC